MDHIDCPVIDQGLETLLKSERVFPCENWCGRSIPDFLVPLPVSPIDEILSPSQLVRFEGLGVPDTVLNRQASKMVGPQRRIPANRFAHSLDEFTQIAQPLHCSRTVIMDGSGSILHQAGVQIHFEERKPHLLAFEHSLPKDLRIRMARGVTVDPDLVPILLAD